MAGGVCARALEMALEANHVYVSQAVKVVYCN